MNNTTDRYHLHDRKDCDATKYKLQGGKYFDRWFSETYAEYYPQGEGEEARE